MIKNKCSPIGPIVLIAVLVCVLALLGQPLSVQAGQTLPPRDPPTTSTPAADKDKGDKDKPTGAYIELQTQIASAGAWSVVQWQDSSGGWQDVEGWRGPLANNNNRRWWVAAKDFGKGPFRWAVTQGQGGSLLGVSTPFNLPSEANQTVQVVVSLKP
jgi:hypothetical protein